MQQSFFYPKYLLLAGFFACAFFPGKLSAQLFKHGNIWYFGYQAGLDFTSGQPAPLSSVNVDSYEGCAVYCNANGQMLFYSNGGGVGPNTINGPHDGFIWNQNQQIMYNMGTTEGGGYSAAQSALILPKPGSPDQYYLFTMEHAVAPLSVNRGLSYFVVDIAANGGLGAVVSANVNVYKPATECLTAIPHVNGTDFWLITVDNTSEDFVVVPVTAAGVGTPFLQPRVNAQGVLVLKASPDGKMICANGELYDFDAANGQIAFKEQVAVSRYTFSFSPASKYLYGFESDFSFKMLRYDLAADTINKTAELLNSDTLLSFPGLMQIGPDGQIYFIEQLEEDFIQIVPPVSLSAIRCPDGATPELERSVFKFPTDVNNAGGLFTSLPNFADYIFATAPLQDSVKLTLCSNATLELIPGGPGQNYQWSTGETTQTIIVDAPGNYAVSYETNCEAFVITFVVSTGNASFEFIVPAISDSCAPFPLVLRVLADTPIQWSDGSSADSLLVLDFGSYSVSVNSPCGDTSATFTLLKPVIINPVQDTSAIQLCSGSTIELMPVEAGEIYQWSTGATTPVLTVDAPGTYSVVVEQHCTLTTSLFTVDTISMPTVRIDFPDIKDSCNPFPLVLRAIPMGDSLLQWQNGSQADTLRIESFGTYTVTATNDCGSATASYTIEAPEKNCCQPLLPNVFTPNGDGVNDRFGLLFAGCEMEYITLNIYARWGELVFQGYELTHLWDGTTLNGTEASADVYVYSVRYKLTGSREQVEQGQVTLLR